MVGYDFVEQHFPPLPSDYRGFSGFSGFSGYRGLRPIILFWSIVFVLGVIDSITLQYYLSLHDEKIAHLQTICEKCIKRGPFFPVWKRL